MKYELVNENVSIDGVNYDTYGIRALCNGEVVSTYHDVSLEREIALRIVNILNDCSAELCHFNDIVTDEINRF